MTETAPHSILLPGTLSFNYEGILTAPTWRLQHNLNICRAQLHIKARRFLQAQRLVAYQRIRAELAAIQAHMDAAYAAAEVKTVANHAEDLGRRWALKAERKALSRAGISKEFEAFQADKKLYVELVEAERQARFRKEEQRREFKIAQDEHLRAVQWEREQKAAEQKAAQEEQRRKARAAAAEKERKRRAEEQQRRAAQEEQRRKARAAAAERERAEREAAEEEQSDEEPNGGGWGAYWEELRAKARRAEEEEERMRDNGQWSRNFWDEFYTKRDKTEEERKRDRVPPRRPAGGAFPNDYQRSWRGFSSHYSESSWSRTETKSNYVAPGAEHYQALGLATGKTYTAAEVRSAYRKRALVLHPDRNGNSPAATEQFKALSTSFDYVLARAA